MSIRSIRYNFTEGKIVVKTDLGHEESFSLSQAADLYRHLEINAILDNRGEPEITKEVIVESIEEAIARGVQIKRGPPRKAIATMKKSPEEILKELGLL